DERIEVVREVAVEGQLVRDDWLPVKIVVVVVSDDPVGLDRIVNTQRMGEHVVPAELALSYPVESRSGLPIGDRRARLLVDRRHRRRFVAIDQILLLTDFQTPQPILRPVGQRKYSRCCRNELRHTTHDGMTVLNIYYF